MRKKKSNRRTGGAKQGWRARFWLCCGAGAVVLQYVRWPVGKVQVQVRGGKLMGNGVRWNAGAAIPDSVCWESWVLVLTLRLSAERSPLTKQLSH